MMKESYVIRALVINPGDRHGTIVHVEPGNLEAFQKLVGGWLEGVPFVNAMALINEEGKLLGLPPNLAATMLAHDVRAIPMRDRINGPMVLVSAKPNGETGDVPEPLLQYIRDMEIEVREEDVP